jgi:hypothetical protein
LISKLPVVPGIRENVGVAENAAILFESLETAAAVADLVGRHEDLYLEVKRCAVPFRDSDKDHLAKALSGFANSDGGVLIYGLVAQGGDTATPDVITKPSPLNDLALAQSGVLSLVGQLVEPPVPGVAVQSRPLSRGPSQGFLLLHVPRSDGMLHRSRRDREYYRRHGHSFLRMEHYEIEEFYGRRKSPLLKIWWGVHILLAQGHAPNRTFSCGVVVGVENIGRGVGKYPGLRIKNHRPDEQFGLNGSGRFGMRRTTSSEPFFFVGGTETVVYPGTMTEVALLAKKHRIAEENPVCPNEIIEFDLYAEDMEGTSGTVTISADEFLEKFRYAVAKFK